MSETAEAKEIGSNPPSLKVVLGDFFVYGFGEILTRASGFITLPIYTRLFAPGEFGIWSMVTTAAGIVSVFFSLGGETAYARLYFDEKNDASRRRLASTWLIFVLGWGAGLLALALPWGGAASTLLLGTPDHATLIWLSILALPISAANSICSQVIRNQFRAKQFVALNLVSTVLTVALSLVCVLVLHQGVAGLFIGVLAASSISLPIRLWVIRSELELTFSAHALKSMLHYGLPLVPMTLAYCAFTMFDRILLGKLSTVAEVGLYSIAMSLTSILYMFNNALGQAWGPHAVRLHAEHPEAAPRIFGRALSYILVVTGALAVVMAAFSSEMLRVLVPQTYWEASRAMGPLALASVAMASTQITALGISLSKRTQYFAIYSWGAAILNVGINVMLIPRLGMLGAAITSAGTYMFLTAAYYWQSQKLIPVAYESGKMYAISLLTIVFTMSCVFFPTRESLPIIAGKVLYVALYLGLLVVASGFTRHDLRRLQSMLLTRLGKKRHE